MAILSELEAFRTKLWFKVSTLQATLTGGGGVDPNSRARNVTLTEQVWTDFEYWTT